MEEWILQACNTLSYRHGGKLVGSVDGFRRQRLISVYAGINEKEEPFIRLGFAQTSLTRAPDGGFEIIMPTGDVAMCSKEQDILDFVEGVLFGDRQGRGERYAQWLTRLMPKAQSKAKR